MSNNKNTYAELISATLDHIQAHYEEKSFLLGAGTNRAYFSVSEPKKAVPRPTVQSRPAVKAPVVTTPLKAPEPLIDKKPAPVAPKQEKIEPVKATPLKPAAIEPTAEIKKQVQKLFPHISMVEEVPSDEKAVLLSQAWKQPARFAEVVILSFSEGAEEELFLQNVKKAIDSHFCPAALVDAISTEKKKEWDPFFTMHKPKIILASPVFLKMQGLLPFYKEIPATSQRFLGESPLVLLSPLVHYLKQPEQKKLLWNTLCQILKRNSSPPSS